MTLPLLSLFPVCTKCGFPSASYKYQSIEAKLVGGGTVKADVEFILRTCGRCGYQWREAPMDAAKAKGHQ